MLKVPKGKDKNQREQCRTAKSFPPLKEKTTITNTHTNKNK